MLEAARLEHLAIVRGLPPVHVREITTSTNADAAALARAGAVHGTAVVADAQTGGRGRLGRRWESPPGVNLYLSIVVRPTFATVAFPLVTLATAVAIAEKVGPKVGIKWPNDILSRDGKKLSGILAEVDSTHEPFLVVGVGLNVHGEPLLDTATTLDTLGDGPWDRTDLTVSLISGILRWVDTLHRPGAVLDAWRSHALTLGRRVRVAGVEGMAVDLDPSGGLLIRLDSGEIRKILAGDVEMVGTLG